MKNIFINFQAFWIVALLAMGSCTTTAPEWHGKIYAGDSVHGCLARNNPGQPDECISANSAEFDHFMAMTYADFRSFYDTYVLGCKSWGKETPTVSVMDLYNQFLTQLPHGRRAD